MATVNKRVGIPQAIVINGIDAGGAMTARIIEGWENMIRSAPDGLQVPVIDRDVQYVRGTVVTQSWAEAVNLLTGVLGTYVFYERKSGGIPEATGFIEHTITNPVIHRIAINITQGGFGTISLDFECRFSDTTSVITDMHALADNHAAPTYVSAARGGFRIETAQFDVGGTPINIYHSTAFDFTITLPLVKACNDGDIGYTCVDARLDGLTATGSLTFQDATIATAALLAQQLLLHARAALQLKVRQSHAATSKLITIAGVIFGSGTQNSDVNAPFTDFNIPFEVGNDPALPLTLAGDNKILTIADET